VDNSLAASERAKVFRFSAPAIQERPFDAAAGRLSDLAVRSGVRARDAGDARTAVVDGCLSETPGREGQSTTVRDADPAAEGSEIVHGGACGDRISKRIGDRG